VVALVCCAASLTDLSGRQGQRKGPRGGGTSTNQLQHRKRAKGESEQKKVSERPTAAIRKRLNTAALWLDEQRSEPTGPMARAEPEAGRAASPCPFVLCVRTRSLPAAARPTLGTTPASRQTTTTAAERRRGREKRRRRGRWMAPHWLLLLLLRWRVVAVVTP
jgi:hypothetical protein